MAGRLVFGFAAGAALERAGYVSAASDAAAPLVEAALASPAVQPYVQQAQPVISEALADVAARRGPWLLEPARTARAPKRCHTALCASALGPLPHASAPRRGPRRWGESNTKAWISDLADVIHARLALLKLEYLPALSKAAGGAPAATAAGESPAVGGSSSQRAASGRHVALLLALAAAAGGLYAVQRVGYDNAVKAVSEVRSAPWRAICSRRGLLRPPSLRRGGRAAPPPRRPPPR